MIFYTPVLIYFFVCSAFQQNSFSEYSLNMKAAVYRIAKGVGSNLRDTHFILPFIEKLV